MSGETESKKDHDLLLRIDTNLNNFMGQFKNHVEDDKDHIDRLYSKTSRIEKIVWMGMGGVAIIELVVRIWK